MAEQANLSYEDIGARRLHELIEKSLEDISFEAPYLENKNVVVDKEFIEK